MASAQVLPNSRKQEHLEAGKRRLEEFRKKKAAERAKKAASTNQPHASDVSPDQKQLLETEHVRLSDSNGVGTSNGPGIIIEPFGISSDNGNSAIDITEKVQQGSMKDPDPDPPSTSDYSTSFSDITHKNTNSYDFKRDDASGFSGLANLKYGQEPNIMNNDAGLYIGTQGDLPYGISPDHSIAGGFQSSSNQLNLYQRESFQSKDNDFSLKDSAIVNDNTHFLTSPPTSSISEQHIFKPSYSSAPATVDSTQPNMKWKDPNSEVDQDMRFNYFNYTLNFDFGGRKFSSLPSSLPAVQTSEPTGFNSGVRISSSHVPPYSVTSGSNSRRSHPSFLDSLKLSRSSSGNSFRDTGPVESFINDISKSNGTDAFGSSTFQKMPVETETARQFLESSPSMPSDGVDMMKSNAHEKSTERNHEFYLPKQNEDFSALEQHIEDLTQEKFSLQRALEASRSLADSLAAENSSLTDNYNQQRGVVNQLKSDMAKLQEEIKVHLVELDSVKIACANAQLECNAADERAKLLASEVIGLEEKALRLRSSELKLERQLENSQAEITSYKKKMSSLEKDRQDLQSTIDALQEEKKLLQSKLRKASVTEKSIGVSRSAEKKDISTSTEDLVESANDIPVTSGHEIHDSASLPLSNTTDFLMLPENGQSNLEAPSLYIPLEQMRMIQNINTIISELTLEKEELMRALMSESSQCSKLKDLNNELSRKLETQTQRLELLTAQSMANENIQARLPDSRTMPDTTTYADEGDEVVERVLGWIMRLFPGGPSRRRISKLL